MYRSLSLVLHARLKRIYIGTRCTYIIQNLAVLPWCLLRVHLIYPRYPIIMLSYSMSHSIYCTSYGDGLWTRSAIHSVRDSGIRPFSSRNLLKWRIWKADARSGSNSLHLYGKYHHRGMYTCIKYHHMYQ